MRLGYTQQSLRILALCQETSDVKPRCSTLAFLAVLLVLCVSVQVFAAPDAPKQFDPKLFQELRWRLSRRLRVGRLLSVTCDLGPPEIFHFRSLDVRAMTTNNPTR